MNRIEIIKFILTEFNAANIKYCVLRNYEFLLDNQEEQVGSLDTLIATKDMPMAHQILIRRGFIKRKPQFSLKHQAYFKLVNLKKVSFDIQVGGIYWNDMSYLTDSIINNRVKKSYLYIPSSNDTFLMLIVHSILGKRFFKPKYQRILYEIKADHDYILRGLTRIFSRRIAKKIIGHINHKTLEKLNIYRLLVYFLIKKPFRLVILAALSWRWIKQKKILLAPLISVLGPDGSGKTTTVEIINSYLKSQRRETALIYMGKGRNHLLPITKLGNIFKRTEKKKEKSLELKQKYSSGNNDKKDSNNYKKKIIYTLATPLFAMDLFLRYCFQILPRRLKHKIVITDRYCSDIILTKHVPFVIKKILFNIFPKPTISIFLYNHPEILHSRRPEESVSELTRQLTIFDKFNYSLSLKTSLPDLDGATINEFIGNYLLQHWK